MKAFREYWTFSAIRGVMTILASAAIFVLPHAAASMLSMPVLVDLAADCYATYCMFDGAVMLLLVRLLPASSGRGNFLYAQAAVGWCAAALLYLMTYGTVSTGWLLWIASAQAAFAAYVEFQIARGTHAQYRCLSCYSTSMILAAASLALPWMRHLEASGLCFAVATYAGLYGLSEATLGGRMLFLEYRGEHPAPAMPLAWETMMDQPQRAG